MLPGVQISAVTAGKQEVRYEAEQFKRLAFVGLGDKTVRRRRRQFVHKFYEHNKLSFTIAMVTLLINSALDVWIAYIMQELLDTASSGTIDRILQLLIMALIYAAVYFITILCANYTRNRFVRRALVQYKAYAFQRITEKSIRSFSEENTSRYISALTNDVTSIEQNRLRAIFTFARADAVVFRRAGDDVLVRLVHDARSHRPVHAPGARVSRLRRASRARGEGGQRPQRGLCRHGEGPAVWLYGYQEL